MELGAVPRDHYAGYVDEDSDLEFSDCSEPESSEDEGPALRGGPVLQRESSSDEEKEEEDAFEREMDSEVVGMLEQLTSPTALRVLLSKEGRKLGTKCKGTTPVPVAASAVLGKSPSTGKESSTDKHYSDQKGRVSKVRFADVPSLPGDVTASSSKQPGSRPTEGDNTEQQEFYDNVYFDSSGSEGSEDGDGGEGGEGGEDVGRKVRKLTNDELFYDPTIDDDNERWVQRQRMAYHNVKVSRDLKATKAADSDGTKPHPPSSAANPVPRSDAVLNCPACMATLCLDCQRHEVYPTQFRAMFALNCSISRDETLKYVPKADRKSRRREKRKNAQNSGASQAASSQQEELYHPVKCNECSTEVAVFDKDEVFHFFNVLASRP